MSEENVVPGGGGAGASLPLEIWIVVAEQTSHRPTLKALATTSHALYDICQTFLYEQRVLRLERMIPDSALHGKSLPPGLKHTKDLKVLPYQLSHYQGVDRIHSINEQFSSFITRMLCGMENLRTFEWHANGYENAYETARILRNPRLLETLKSLPRLRNVLIQFTTETIIPINPTFASKCFVPLEGFRNLTSLELYEFHDQGDVLVRKLAQALKESPYLKKLGLGLNCDFDERTENTVTEFNTNFLERLCLQYASEANTKPLPLETLRLGSGVSIFSSFSGNEDNYMAKLVKVDGLRTLDLFNGWIDFCTDETGGAPRIDYGLLEDCKSLHRLSISRLSMDLIVWLNNSARNVQELLVTDYYEMDEKDLDLLTILGLKELSMLYFHISSAGQSSQESPQNQGPETDLYDPEGYPLKGYGMPKDLIPLVTAAHRIGIFTDLSHLTRLSICLEFETQWELFDRVVLPELKSLHQLRLKEKSQEAKIFPPREANLWPDTNSPMVVAARYAVVIHKRCPSLRYIRIGFFSWRIPSCLPDDDDGSGLVPLTKSDLYTMDLEILTLCGENTSQSGLLSPDYSLDWSRDKTCLNRMPRFGRGLQYEALDYASHASAVEVDNTQQDIQQPTIYD